MKTSCPKVSPRYCSWQWMACAKNISGCQDRNVDIALTVPNDVYGDVFLGTFMLNGDAILHNLRNVPRGY